MAFWLCGEADACNRDGLARGIDLLRSVRMPVRLRPKDLPSGVRDEEGDEDLLVRRVPGDLSVAAGCHHDCDDCPPPPRCGQPKCVKKLVKKEYQVEVPVYKCVVRYLCPECCKADRQTLPAPRPTLRRHPQPQ